MKLRSNGRNVKNENVKSEMINIAKKASVRKRKKNEK